MNKEQLKAWVAAARLRTLPLSLAGIIVGNGLAYFQGYFNVLIFLFSVATTIAFQILSNFANDYGDGIKGTDNEQRLGPSRVLQQGLLSAKEMKQGIIVTSIISFALTILLLLISFSMAQISTALFFLFLGVISIVAAIKYTVGSSAYGYFAMGDLFVFLFFGGLSVIGSNFLQTHSINYSLLFPAMSMGLLSTAVLNLNNMRDVDNDLNSHKITLPILLGEKLSKYYHGLLILVPFITASFFLYQNSVNIFAHLHIIFLVPLGLHLIRVWRCKHPIDLDPELKKVALSTFFFGIAFILSLIGVFGYLALTGNSFVILMTMMGIIALSGIVVNNGVVLLDYSVILLNRKKQDQANKDKKLIELKYESIVESCKSRLRPVLLTAITTIGGLIPLAAGFNINFYTLFSDLNPNIYWGGDNFVFWGPLAVTVISGLVVATFLTLFVVPSLFMMIEKFKLWIGLRYR